MINQENVMIASCNGVGIYLMKDERKVGYIQAITWRNKENLKGELLFASISEIADSFSIQINILTEENERKTYILRNVSISFSPKDNIGIPLSFEADKVEEIK